MLLFRNFAQSFQRQRLSDGEVVHLSRARLRTMLLMRLVILALVAVWGLPVDRVAHGETFQSPTMGEVRFIYLVPSDRSISSVYPDHIAAAARHFQSWLGQKLEGRTIRLGHPAVRILRSDKPARWFSAVDRYRGFDAFYRNALDELTRLGAAKLNDPEARYVVYVDADHACGQSGAGGNGLAVVSANDLRGISGEAIIPACEKPNGAEIVGRCRWIGGMGHELLHTLGLRHPDRSPTCQTSQCRSKALMMQGYITYPNAVLLDEETASLQRSPFIRADQIDRLPECGGP